VRVSIQMDTRTPVKIALVVLVLTQVFNWLLVPHLQHAALTLSIGLGALINAAWLGVGLYRRGSYQPRPGWLVFSAQVFAACALLTVFLLWTAGKWDWVGLRGQPWHRIGLMAAVVVAAMALYAGALLAAGVRLRQFLRR